MLQLNETGKNFIRTICAGNGDSLISGKNRYNLSFSPVQDTPTTFTANAVDHLGQPITSNQQLGEALIFWYNKFAEISRVDASILAAQGYAESRYRLWHYGRASSSQGLSDLTSRQIYRYIINNTIDSVTNNLENLDLPPNRDPAQGQIFGADTSFTSPIEPIATEEESNRMSSGLTDPDLESSYVYRGLGVSKQTLAVALDNRLPLFQNAMDNPDLMIKAQAVIMKRLLRRNNNNVAAALFCYNLDTSLIAQSYPLLVDNARSRFGKAAVQETERYVEYVFRILGDKNNDKVQARVDKPRGIFFAYNIDFQIDDFNAFLG
jgi:hypothetical protein